MWSEVTSPDRTLVRPGTCLAMLCCALSVLADPPVIPAEVQASIRARVDYAYNPGIIVGMVNQDGRTWFSYGQTAYDSDVLPDEHTLYEIGSVTKVFTSTLLSEMVAQGEVQLSEPVQSLLPESVNVPARNGIQISLEHLATHSSGLPLNPPLDMADPLNPFAGVTEESLYAFLQIYMLPRDPGSEFDYSNLGVGILGHALANHLQIPYEDALRVRVLQPLGLTDTVITPSAEQIARRASGYWGVVPRPPVEMASLEGAAALLSTVEDLLTFLEYQLGFRTNQLTSVILATQTARFSTPTEGLQIGLGWFVFDNGSIQFTYHGGSTLGQTAFLGFDRQSGTGVVVLTNARENQNAAIQDIGLKLLAPQLLLTTIVPPVDVPLETLQNYVGKYQATDGSSFDIGLLRGHLTATYSGLAGAAVTLYPENQQQFWMLDTSGNAIAVFQTDPFGHVTSMTWSQPGYTDDFQKQKLPVNLALKVVDGSVQLTLSGETGTDYVIEVSENLTNWTAIATNTISDAPIMEPWQPGITQRFFQAHTME